MKKLISGLIFLVLLSLSTFHFTAYESTSNIYIAVQDPLVIEEKTEITKLIEEMTLEEKIGQFIVLMAPSGNKIKPLETYHIGGYIFGYNEIENHTKESLKQLFQSYNSISKIPLYFAIDEEGGTVTKLSYNNQLYSGFFESPKKLYEQGRFAEIRKDTKVKSELLTELGFSINFAPVADVATNPDSYMWERSFSSDYQATAEYIRNVYEISQNYPISYAIKHFPGHGDYEDPHQTLTTDYRSLEEYKEKDFLPFIQAIESKTDMIMLDHLIMTVLDPNNPVTLSKTVIDYLKTELHYQGLILSDCLSMIDIENKYSKAIMAGVDLIIVKDYKKAVFDIQTAVVTNKISEEEINRKVKKILENKYEKGLINSYLGGNNEE